MIEVIYYREHNRVTVTGHANAAPIGEDLVCSAASILTRTLAANVEHLVKAGAARDSIIRLEEGDAEISCKVSHKFKAVAETIFSGICVGFEILADGAPDFISYSVRG